MADNFTNKLGLQLYGNTEYDRAKKGFDWAQSINGNTQYSAFSKIDVWADYISKLVGSGTLYGGLTDCISAINSLNSTMQNTVQGVIVNGTELNKVNNKVSFTVPTKTSEITNDSHITITKAKDEITRDAINFGDTINLVKDVVRDEYGHVTQIKSVSSTFPVISVNDIDTGSGNAITKISVNNGVIKGIKEETFATKESVDNIPKHDNIEQLNKIGENESGQFTYNGQVISGGGGGTGSVDSITVNGTNYTPTDGVVTLPNYSAQFVSNRDFGGNTNEITTSEFITLLKSMGAFSKGYWCARGSWSYNLNQIITDTGCGNIQLAGCVVEVFNDINSNGKYYTIRITTPSTSIRGTDNAEFIYVNNEDDSGSYNPCWRRSYNTLNKPEEISTMQSDIENLKNNVVNWKQPIVTAVNDKCGTSLTTETSGDDIAYYINNIISTKQISFNSDSDKVFTMGYSDGTVEYELSEENFLTVFKGNSYYSHWKVKITPLDNTVYCCLKNNGLYQTINNGSSSSEIELSEYLYILNPNKSKIKIYLKISDSSIISDTMNLSYILKLI